MNIIAALALLYLGLMAFVAWYQRDMYQGLMLDEIEAHRITKRQLRARNALDKNRREQCRECREAESE